MKQPAANSTESRTVPLSATASSTWMPTPQFRQGSLDSETFALYSERYCWNITFCGAEALRVYNHDYLAQTADGKKYLLNMHIKYGVKVQELVRIYFCWDDALQKVILGYLPDHLPTLKDPT